MEKTERKTPQNNLNAPDWFMPAILCDGTVGDAFNAVLTELHNKANAISLLHTALCSKDSRIDNLSTMSRRFKDLESTLRLRLGLLDPSKPQGWFRESVKRELGPFRGEILTEPVFCQYRSVNTAAVKAAIYECWVANGVNPERIPFDQRSSCLWLTLLSYKNELWQIDSAPKPAIGSTLSQFDNALPASLESKSLRAFLLNVKGELLAVRARLNLCFDQLWSSSERFWQEQQPHSHERSQGSSSAGKENKKQSRESTRENSGSKSSRGEPVQIGFAEMQALKFMGFRARPDKQTLRTRYLELAKKFHPDRKGGNDESFKLLNKAYSNLLELIV